jgi:hypothetical protein
MMLDLGRVAIGLTADESTWQALQYPGWNDPQLAELQHNWESVEFIPAMEHALAEHRARILELIAALRRNFEPYGPGFFDLRKPPTGQPLIISLMSNPGAWAGYCKKRYLQYWSWKNSDSFHDELCVMNATEAALGVYRSLRSDPRDFATTMSTLKSALPESNLESTHSKHSINTPRVASALLSCTLCAETKRQLAITAIAIKRYQLAHGRLPDSLADLVPAFLSKPILDPMDGKPLRYRPNPDGTFQLYSVGFDGRDNGGTGTSNNSLEEGTDLVWPIPARR